MTQETANLLQKALALSDTERADLASSLIDSLDTTIDVDVETAWQQEIARRLEELRSGKAKTISWEAVRERARALVDGKTRS